MVLTAVISMFTSGYALSMAFSGERYAPVIAIGGGIAWGIFVFCVDRLIVADIDKFSTSWAAKGKTVAIRVPIALVVAAVMSTPLVLRCSRAEIESELQKEKRDLTRQEASANAEEAGLPDRINLETNLEKERKLLEQRIHGTPDSPEYQTALEAAEKAESLFRNLQATDDPKIRRTRAEIARLEQRPGPADAIATTRTALQSRLTQWRRELAQARSAALSANNQVETAKHHWLLQQTTSMEDVSQQLARARSAEKAATDAVAAKNTQSSLEVARITALNLINAFRMLRRITRDPSNHDRDATATFERALHLLFALLELTPMMWKLLAKANPLDHAVHSLELQDIERLTLATNIAMRREQSKANDVMSRIEETQKLRLKSQLRTLRYRATQLCNNCRHRPDGKENPVAKAASPPASTLPVARTGLRKKAGKPPAPPLGPL
jgi:hypothetical protein